MRFTSLFGASLLLASAANAIPAAVAKTSSTSTLPTAASTNTAVAAAQLEDLLLDAIKVANNSLKDAGSKRSTGCTLQNVSIRREWSTLSSSAKTAYINAVVCLQSKTANTPNSLVAGAKSRFDDFVATHINQTMTIHYTGTFLAWHRYFLWTYENALRTECGYTGTQPYWDWSKSAASGLESYALFDGSATSISGNGAAVSGETGVVLGGNGLPEIDLPAGTGGGCVTSGPFKDMKVNLGPVDLNLANGSTVGALVSGTDIFAYNPRCLKRDLTTAVNKAYANATSIVNLIVGSPDVDTFQMTMQGVPGSGQIGVHGGGHYSMGGDPGRDLFVSPGDPAFYFHHAMIDRTWWIWQMLNATSRLTALSGTNTFLNSPPSADTTLDTPVDLGYAGPFADAPSGQQLGQSAIVGDLMSTTAGPFCYVYL